MPGYAATRITCGWFFAAVLTCSARSRYPYAGVHTSPLILAESAILRLSQNIAIVRRALFFRRPHSSGGYFTYATVLVGRWRPPFVRCSSPRRTLHLVHSARVEDPFRGYERLLLLPITTTTVFLQGCKRCALGGTCSMPSQLPGIARNQEV